MKGNCHRHVFYVSTFVVLSFSVPSGQCVAPTLEYGALTTQPQEDSRPSYLYTMSPFNSSCSGRVVGYWFCYQNTSSTTGERVNISTVLLLEDMGAKCRTVKSFTVEVIPGRENCLSGSQSNGQCCVTRNLGAESQFGVNSSYLYGVVDLPGGPNMVLTHVSVGRPGYPFNAAEYTDSGDTALRKSGDPTNQPLTMFQFIIGMPRFAFVNLLMDQIMPSLVFQRIPLPIQLLPQHPLVPHPLLARIPLTLPQTVKPPLSPLTPHQTLPALLPQG